MASFFVNRPIVAIVISIIMTIVGVATFLGLPVAQFPNIVPPEIQVKTTYTGADALTVEQSVATPIEQQMSGVDNMNYMSSVNGNDGTLKLTVNFDVTTDPSTDQILSQMRSNQASSQLPEDVNKFGVTVQKSTSSPLIMFSLYSPKGTYDSIFLANYANINLNDEFTRVPGIASVTIFGAGQYAMRIWVKPDHARQARSHDSGNHPCDQITERGEPGRDRLAASQCRKDRNLLMPCVRKGACRARRSSERSSSAPNPDGSMLRVKDVARIELGAQNYAITGRLNGKPAAIVALYQLPGSNALAAAEGAKKKMKELSERFPADLDYVVSLDTTLAVTEGMVEIQHTLLEALVLVILVVFIFLQGWRATLIPLLAVPVSLIGTFALFPLFGFTVNTLSLFGLVLAIGIVVDDAIVVVEAVEHHIEHGLSPREATFKAMAGSQRAGHRHCAGAGGSVCADSLHSGHYRKVVSAICRDDRRLDAHLGIQCAHAFAGARRNASQAEEEGHRSAAKVFRLVQSRLRRGDKRLRLSMPVPHPQADCRRSPARRRHCPHRDARQARSGKLPARRRPGVFLCASDSARRSFAPAHR